MLASDVKKKNNITKSIGTLFLSFGIIFVSLLVLANLLGYGALGWGKIMKDSAIFAVAGFVVSLMFSLFITVGLNVMGGKGKIVDGISAVAYSTLYGGIGLLVSSLIAYIPSVGDWPVGFWLAGLVFAFFSVLDISIFFRLLKDLFDVDSALVLLGTLVIFYSAFFGFYFFLSAQAFSFENLVALIQAGAITSSGGLPSGSAFPSYYP